MVIPAGQNLFARLFGQADDMHAGGSFLHSAFYGGRIAGAMTFGLAAKLIRGGTSVSRNRKRKQDENSKDNNEESSEKYSEDKSSDTGGESE